MARARVDKDAPRLAVYAHMFFMDEMWHNFALFTKEYSLFCETFLGGYIHHLPMTRAEQERLKAKYKKNPKATARRMEQQKLEQCNFIFHELGEPTLKKWYSEFPERYTPEFVNSRRRPLGHAGT